MSWFFRVFGVFSTLGALGCAGPHAVTPGLGYPAGAQPRGTERPSASAPPLTPSASTSAPGSTLATSSASSGTASALSSFGTERFAGEGPLLVERASIDGRWVAVCQARKDSNADGQLSVSVGARGELQGDALDRYLIAPGEELSHDGLVGADASGRYALLVQHGALTLWDSQSRQSLDLSTLGADARLSAESFAELRTVAFDASSEHLLYVRPNGPSQRLVIRTLSDGSELELDPGPEPIWRARFDPGGSYAVLEMLTEDSNKNGKADFPAPLLRAPRPCSAGPGRFHTWVDRGDRPEAVLVPLLGGPPIHEPELVMPVLDALLLRDENGALLLERGAKKQLLEPAACKGRIVHADAQRGLFIIGCAQKKKTGRVSLELVTSTEHKSLDLELASTEQDHDLSDSARLVPLYPGLESALFDADHREVLPLQTGDVVIAVRAARALIRRGKTLLFYDADSRTEQALPFTLERFPDVLVSAPFAFVSPVLVNLETGSVVGQSQERPLALSNAGQLLVSDAPAESSRLVRGPLRWVTPGL